MESFLESHELLVDTNLESPLNVKWDVFLLVFIGDGNVLAIGLEVMVGDSSKSVMLHTEGHVKHTIYIILPKERRERERRIESEGGRGGGGGGGRERIKIGLQF